MDWSSSDSPVFDPGDHFGPSLEDFDSLPPSDHTPSLGSLPDLTPDRSVPEATSSSTVVPPLAKNGPSKKRRGSGILPDIADYFRALTDSYNETQRKDPTCFDTPIEYNPEDEDLPKLPIYHPYFKKGEHAVNECISDLRNTLRLSGDKDTESMYILDQLNEVATPKYPSPCFTIFYGNSGTGKSSLVNASLGIKGLSSTSCSGEVGTLVPIEHWQAPDNQPYPYSARVFFFPRQICLEVVIRAFRDYYLHRIASDDEMPKNEGQYDLGKPALKILCALFAGFDEFRDQESAIEFLSRARSINDPAILKILRDRTGYVLDELAILGTFAVFDAYTPKDLNTKLEPFTQESEFPDIDGTSLQCSVWPFVSHVRKLLRHPILQCGNVFADVPGVSDGNPHRQRVAQKFLRACDKVIVVNTIERAADEQCVENFILEAWNRKRHGSVALVLTKCDIVEEEQLSTFRLTNYERELLNSIEQYETDLQSEVRDITRSRFQAQSSEFVRELVSKERLYEYLLRETKSKRLEVLVQARNRNITKILNAWYQSRTRDPNPLPIFCTSTKSYLQHIDKHLPLKPPILPIDATGMPAFRKYLFALAGEKGKAEHLGYHCGTLVRGLMERMELSCSGFKPMMRRDRLVTFVNNAPKKVQNRFEAARVDFWKTSVTPVIASFDSLGDAWVTDLAALCNTWAKYHPSGHHAFVRKNGNWKTTSCGAANWNASMIKIIRKDIQPKLDHLRNDGCDIFGADLMQTVSDALDEMEAQMRMNLDVSQSNAFKVFFSSVSSRKREASNEANNVIKEVQRSLLSLNNDSMTDDIRSPFTIRMHKIYAVSLQATPDRILKTKHAARCATFKDLICDKNSGPVHSVQYFLEQGIDKILGDAERRFTKFCEKMFEDIEHDFNNVCPERETTSLATLKRREELGKKVKETVAVLDGTVKEYLAECGVKMA